jgi:hypothetical protein
MNLAKIQKKQQEKEEKERKTKAEAFLKSYKELVEQTGIEWTCELEYRPGGISPRLRLAEYRPQQVTSWAEAKRQNLEVRKSCVHAKRDDGVEECRLCGLSQKYWGENNIGATQEYSEMMEQKIKMIEESENQKKEMEA